MEGTAPKVRELEPDDAVLVERFLKGDKRAFRQIYDRHARSVAAVAYRTLGDDQGLSDIVQDTFFMASEGMHRIQDPSRLRSWLITIAIRRVRHTIRQRRRGRALKRELQWNAVPVATHQVPSEVEDLREALSALSPKLRIPWVLRRIEGESLTETARMTGISVATVKRRVEAAEKLIEKRMKSDS